MKLNREDLIYILQFLSVKDILYFGSCNKLNYEICNNYLKKYIKTKSAELKLEKYGITLLLKHILHLNKKILHFNVRINKVSELNYKHIYEEVSLYFYNNNNKILFTKNKIGYREVYLENGKIHNLYGPANLLFYKNGIKQMFIYCINSIYHNINGPAVISWNDCGKVVDKTWFYNGNIMNINNGLAGHKYPARIKYYDDGDICKLYYSYGMLEREEVLSSKNKLIASIEYKDTN